MNKPIAVILGDIHFTVPTLELATSAVAQAKSMALSLGVPLILNGDTLDSKAIVRGECANRLIELFGGTIADIIVNTGNHDLINEKGSEHVLNFLKPYCDVIQSKVYIERIQSYVIPYQTSPQALQSILDGIPKGSRLIMHQGVQSAYLGHYTQDKTSLPQDSFADFRVIASHYHRRQDIKCGILRDGNVGLFSYIGNPYTLNFGEASDGPKGFSILYKDGSLEFVPTNLRKHVILEVSLDSNGGVEFDKRALPASGDITWVKASGPRSSLEKFDRKWFGTILGTDDYKLEKLYSDAPVVAKKAENVSNADLFDSIIDAQAESIYYKASLKCLWKELV